MLPELLVGTIHTQSSDASKEYLERELYLLRPFSAGFFSQDDILEVIDTDGISYSVEFNKFKDELKLVITGAGPIREWFKKHYRHDEVYKDTVYFQLNQDKKSYKIYTADEWLTSDNDIVGSNLPPKSKKLLLKSVKQDAKKKAQVERAAVEYVADYYKSEGYEVTSVEAAKCGWDLSVVKGKDNLLVEVKGRSKGHRQVELTPNEYAKMKLCRGVYRIAVVLNAIDSPDLHILSYSAAQNVWESDSGLKVEIKKINVVKARLTLQ